MIASHDVQDPANLMLDSLGAILKPCRAENQFFLSAYDVSGGVSHWRLWPLPEIFEIPFIQQSGPPPPNVAYEPL